MNQEEHKKSEIQLGPSYEQIQKRWDSFSPIYIQFDSAPQTFFYTLANMLKLNEAKNVLEIACGAGKLIPHVLDLKSKDTFYYATDISTEMLHWARVRLENHFQKYESKLTLDEWMKKQNLEFGQVNGEEKIPKEIKFDRIICNLVLMLTTDPAKMLRNLYDSAEDGCLLGLTVWGQKQRSNLFRMVQDLSIEHNLMPPNSRSNFFLSDKIETLVQECGWEKILGWQQIGMFPIIEHSSEKLHPLIEKEILVKFPKELHPKIMEKIDQWINKEKCGLTFACKLMIVKKKSKKE